MGKLKSPLIIFYIMIKQLHPYQEFIYDLIQLYFEMPPNYCTMILVNNDIPISIDKDILFNLDELFWLNQKQSYCLLHFEKHKFKITSSKLINSNSIHILVTDKITDEYVAEYNTIDYRIVWDWMKKYFC